MTKENDFQKIADNTEETLDRVSKEILGAMEGIQMEKYNTLWEQVENKIIDEMTEVFQKEMGVLPVFRSGWEFETKKSFARILHDFPTVCGEHLIKKLLEKEEWKYDEYDKKRMGNVMVSIAISVLCQHYAEIEENTRKSYNSDSPIPPIFFNLSEDLFIEPPTDFGVFLPKHASLSIDGNTDYNTGTELCGGTITVNGNTGDMAGNHMKNGNLVINGNTGSYVGMEMEGGSLVVNGKAGKYAGWNLSGGTLTINGEVESFLDSAFNPKKRATIIWKGITIWNEGKWTEEGKRMRDTNKIPGIHTENI